MVSKAFPLLAVAIVVVSMVMMPAAAAPAVADPDKTMKGLQGLQDESGMQVS